MEGPDTGAPVLEAARAPAREGLRSGQTPIVSRLLRWARTPEFIDAVLPTLGIRIALLCFAPVAVVLLGDANARAGLPINIWNAWDAPHYLEVARVGYDPAGDPARAVLFPFLPLLLRTGSILMSG